MVKATVTVFFQLKSGSPDGHLKRFRKIKNYDVRSGTKARMNMNGAYSVTDQKPAITVQPVTAAHISSGQIGEDEGQTEKCYLSAV